MTPEQVASAFLTAWRRRNWKAMRGAVQVSQRGRATAGLLKGTFGTKQLTGFAIGETTPFSEASFLIDEATGKKLWMTPDAVTVGAVVTYRIGSQLFRRRLSLVVAREGSEGRPVGPDEPAGWGVNDISALREEPA